jgi:hypothetical protein
LASGVGGDAVGSGAGSAGGVEAGSAGAGTSAGAADTEGEPPRIVKATTSARASALAPAATTRNVVRARREATLDARTGVAAELLESWVCTSSAARGTAAAGGEATVAGSARAAGGAYMDELLSIAAMRSLRSWSVLDAVASTHAPIFDGATGAIASSSA